MNLAEQLLDPKSSLEKFSSVTTIDLWCVWIQTLIFRSPFQLDPHTWFKPHQRFDSLISYCCMSYVASPITYLCTPHSSLGAYLNRLWELRYCSVPMQNMMRKRSPLDLMQEVYFYTPWFISPCFCFILHADHFYSLGSPWLPHTISSSFVHYFFT